MLAFGLENLPQAITLLAVGTLAGVLGGLLGIGGGLVIVPALLLLLGESAYGLNSLHLYKLAALATAVALSLTAIPQHVRARAMRWRVVAWLVPAGWVGVAIGIVVASLFTDHATRVLKALFGAFMIVSVLAGWIWAPRRDPPGGDTLADKPASPWRLLKVSAIVGAPSGMISGLLGVGGGIWAVPVQHFAFATPLRVAVANSSGMVLALTLAATVGQTIAVSRLEGVAALDAFRLTVWLAPGAIAGGWIGAGLTHRLPVRVVRRVLDVLLMLVGLRLMLA